jgi:hypothetical protein
MLLALLASAVPRMIPKAYRWIAEMEEIASFHGDPGMRAMFMGAAQIYRRIEAARAAGDERGELAVLERFTKGLAGEKKGEAGG